MSRKKSKKTNKRPAVIHVPEGMTALFTEDEITGLKRRVNRRLGTCGICHKSLGRKRDLAMVLAPSQVDDLATLAGSWQVTLTHRACKAETVMDMATLVPQHTYTTTLMALPVINEEGLPQQVPTLLINPSVDHFALLKTKDGPMADRTLQHLVDEVGFARMDSSESAPDSEGLEAYVNGANVTVADNDNGISWTHEQETADPRILEQLSASFRTLLEAWDDILLVMVSTEFRANDPNRLMTELPQLIQEGKVHSAPAKVQYKESNAALVEKAFAASTGLSADG